MSNDQEREEMRDAMRQLLAKGYDPPEPDMLAGSFGPPETLTERLAASLAEHPTNAQALAAAMLAKALEGSPQAMTQVQQLMGWSRDGRGR